MASASPIGGGAGCHRGELSSLAQRDRPNRDQLP
ncbi:hypothetical protein PVAP13_3NG093427 [Panicum virgatum]|uniref:Uncharacterized protein n=1 Tax=Panicum virgatum TaxID=38727 RepID=A0A8T0U5H2_PANVG|nr:hypothetical protein PVAP13_3NG093427 [Panicum virgatum]